MLLRFFHVLTLLVASALVAPAQDTPETAPTLPATVEEALELEHKELEAYWKERPQTELEGFLELWMGFVKIRQGQTLAALEADEGSDQHDSATQLASDRDELIGMAEKLIGMLTKAGGDVAKWRADIATIREADASALNTSTTAPSDQTRARKLPIEVLRAQLRPMTKTQVEDQLVSWIDLLQKKCIEVSKVEIASLQAEEGADIGEFTERSVTLWAEREQLIERVRVVVDALEAKGGDVTESRAYLESVVHTPGVNMRTALAALLSWLTNPDGGLALIGKLALALGILFASWVASGVAKRVIGRGLKNVRRISKLLRDFITGSVRNVILALGVLIALGKLGFDMGPLMAAIGAMGLVVGLALQDTLGNFASGIMIMVYRPFDVGDVVTAGGVTGTVAGMTLVTTKIKTFDNQVIYIPNNMMWGDIITNVTSSKTRRVDMVFGIGYGDDVRKAKEVLQKIVAQQEKVLSDPEPIIQVHELGDSSVNFVVRPWVNTVDYWDVYWALNQAVKERFDAEGISIPFPQRDVHLYPTAPPAGLPTSDDIVTPAQRPAASQDVSRS